MTISSSISFFLDCLSQCYAIPQPLLTEGGLASQLGRVCLITGGYTGVGKELARILYSAECVVYIAGRSEDKFKAASDEIISTKTTSRGRLEFLKLDLGDCKSVRNAALLFLQQEERLDVLVNNAGVMVPPVGSITSDGHELQIGTNVLGPWLLTTLLTPLLQSTAARIDTVPGSTRVLWASSLAHIGCPPSGVAFDSGGQVIAHGNRYTDYAQSKAANILLAREYQKRFGILRDHSSDEHEMRIVSIAFHPGALRTQLQRHQTWFEDLVAAAVCHPAVFGAYTVLWAGWSKVAGRPENLNRYVVPWGRFGKARMTVEQSEMGSKLWTWCEREARGVLRVDSR